MNVEDYCSKMGWYLVTIPAGSKGPTKFGWQQPEKALSDPAIARDYYEKNPTHNVGLLHGASGTCAVDIDNVENTKLIFEELGIDFSLLMNSAPQIIGRENRGKLIFKAPDDLTMHKISWPNKDDPRKTETVFELRAGSVQDVLPPSIHPDTGRPYEWSGMPIWDGLPELPPQLLTLWRDWDKFRTQLQDICPWKRKSDFQPTRKPRPKGDSTSVIDAYNEAHDMHTLLVQYGYKPTSRGRYLSPNSSSGLAGVKLFDDGRAYSHHASDPFDSAHSFDAFELFLQYEHMGNVTKAVKDAANLLNVTQNPDYEYDREAIEHGAKVAAQILSKPKKTKQGPLEDVPEDLLSVPGILQDVVNYYTVTAIKPQPQFAVQAAIAFGSVVMGRRWVTDQRNFSSLYFLNIGETGSGKEHSKTVLEDLLEEAGLDELIGPAGYTSAAGVISTLTKKPTHVSVVDELGRQLKSAAARGMQHKADALTTIMECFGRQDGTLRQQGYATNTMKSSEAEKLEKVVKRPSLTLVGMSTPSEFLQAIGGGDVASGLLNRFIIVRSGIGVQMSQKKRRSNISERLASWAKEHAKAQEGDLDTNNAHDLPPHPIEVTFTPEAEDMLRDYEERLVDAIKKENGSGLEDMYNRSREVAMRLSLIIARSMGQDEIGIDAMQWSIDYIDHYAKQAIEMFRANMAEGPFQATCKQVFEKIERSGLEGITASQISRTVSAFANLEPKRRQDVLDALEQDRGIQSRCTNTGQRGKPRFAYFCPPLN
tara:strand:+ start:887 stop:3178 length:2292 start_codon:yes stop_codon:yes gene_type:complete